LDEQLMGLGEPYPAPDKKLFLRTEREDRMPSLKNEASEWLDRVEQAREVAGQLTDPAARNAVLALADNFDCWRKLPLVRP
jgi:hypothetical protein